jgi:hypothetical protein
MPQAGLTVVRVRDFLPSTHGLRFGNAWPHEPDLALRIMGRKVIGIGDAANGLCGGMSFVISDHHLAGAPIWPDAAPPAEGSSHFRTIVRRQIDSLAFGRLPLRFYSLQAFRPDRPTAWSRLLRRASRAPVTVRDEWPKIRADLDAGRLVNLGLVRTAASDPRQLTRNHQVLAFGYTLSAGSLAIAIYDSNHPFDDTVELRVELDDAGRVSRLAQSTGEPLLAFFRAPYSPKPPTD